MFDFMKKRGVKVIKKTKPGMCGGTDATLDTKAPKQIASDDMILFDATSALGRMTRDGGIGYISAFAAPCGDGTFMMLETSEGFRRGPDRELSIAVLKENVFPCLVSLVKECDLAQKNGYHSTTHGLPENFGGRVEIRYGSGEKISFSDNQSPIMSADTADKINKVFKDLMKREKTVFPDLKELNEIRFSEQRKNGGYTKAVLTIREDGSAVNAKESRYDGPDVYKSEKTVDKKTVGELKENVDKTFLLAWGKLPSTGFEQSGEKHLTFVFDNGSEITVKSDRKVPDQIRGGFFKVELEMTTKN